MSEHALCLNIDTLFYQPEQLRKGADDDVVVNLRISEASILSNICLVDWNSFTYTILCTMQLYLRFEFINNKVEARVHYIGVIY